MQQTRRPGACTPRGVRGSMRRPVFSETSGTWFHLYVFTQDRAQPGGHRRPGRPLHRHLGPVQPSGQRTGLAGTHLRLLLLAVPPQPEPAERPLPQRRTDAHRPGTGRPAHPQHPHLFGPGRARRHPGAGRGVRPARQPGHLARPGPGQQRGRDRPRHPHRQRVAERGASDSRQRGAVPPRGDGGTVDRLPRPGPRGGQGSGDHRRTVARLPRTPGTGATRRPDRRPRPALLGGHAGGRRGGLRARTRARTQGRLPEEAAAARRGRLAEQRAHARQRRGDTRGPGHLPAAPDQRAQRRRLQLLRHRSLRPALEGQRRRLGGRLLGRLQRRPQGQVQLHRAGGADSQVARPGHRLGGTRGTRLHPAADRQFLAAPAREDLPRRGLVRLRLGAGVDRLRLQPAVQHLAQPDRRRVAGRRRAGGGHRAVHRGPRAGRGGLDAQAAPAIPADHRRAGLSAQGVDPRALLQRAAGTAEADPRRPCPPRLPGLRSPGDRQQHPRPGRLAAGRGALRAPGRALPLLPTLPRWKASRPAR